MNYSPEANNGTQGKAYNSNGGFEHSHPPFPPEGHTHRL
jgi:hypothetical protein